MLYRLKKLSFLIVCFSGLLYGQSTKHLTEGQIYVARESGYVFSEAKMDSILLKLIDGDICGEKLISYKQLLVVRNNDILMKDTLISFIKKQDSIHTLMSKSADKEIRLLEYKIKATMVMAGIIIIGVLILF